MSPASRTDRELVFSRSLVFEAEAGIRDSCVTALQTYDLLISSRRRHTRSLCDWSSDVCSSDLELRRQGVVDDRQVRVQLDIGQRPRQLEVQADVEDHSLRVGHGDRVGRGDEPEAYKQQTDPEEIGRASCRERG